MPPTESILRGIPGSPGVAIGPAFCFRKPWAKLERQPLAPGGIDKEVERLRSGIMKSAAEIQKVRELAAQRVGLQKSAIFEAQLLMLSDPVLIRAIEERIAHEQIAAESIIAEEFGRQEEALRRSPDSAMQERAADIEDVKLRLLRNLQRGKWIGRIEREAVIVSSFITPADTILFSRSPVLGFATDAGGVASHAVILSRALDIPAVVGLGDVSASIAPGAIVIVDGDEGLIVLNPSDDTLRRYQARRDELRRLTSELGAIASLPAVTADGRRVSLEANLDRVDEIELARRSGATGVGLVRTEHLVIERGRFPTEDEQVEFYRALSERMYPHPVTVRVFDLGSDKVVEGVTEPEENPALGWRGIRMLLDSEEVLLTQLRAILRASALRNLRILLPMVGSIEQFAHARAVLERARAELRAEGARFDDHIKLGAMIEVPSAALLAHEFAIECDFLSIGTNDLTQYTLGVDRANSRVAPLYEEFHPAVIRLIRMVTEAAHREETPVAVCGELASNPLATPLLLGLGVDELSVNCSRLLHVKQAIRSTTIANAERLARAVLTMRTADQIRTILESARG
jgi:phosphotransferase system enzyme I (PtsI)